MKVKGFSDWLGESTGSVKDYGKLGAVAKWYNETTDLGQLFGTGIWCIKYWDDNLDRLEEILARLEELTGFRMRPISAATNGEGHGRVKAYFGSDMRKGDLENFSDSIDSIRAQWKGLGISGFAANYSGIRGLDLERLETGQLLTILDWSKRILSAEGAASLEGVVKGLPNWRDDRVDWALGDW